MGTYNLPRNVKGEGRILFIFSRKALIYTIIGATIGLVFNFIFGLFGLNVVGIIIMVLLALFGFVISTFKMPNNTTFKITKKTGGQEIDDVLKRLIKFKMKKNKIYYYKINESSTEEGGRKHE
ncbi:MAG: PrgI family protein [Clostridia bacterium]|nr:PrgI family protein [Clostridia bacterium]